MTPVAAPLPAPLTPATLITPQIEGGACCEPLGGLCPETDIAACTCDTANGDPFCCQGSWDFRCVTLAKKQCGMLCPAKTAAHVYSAYDPAGPCCFTQEGTCDNQEIRDCVCDTAHGGDDFCCLGNWDEKCVGIAKSVCQLKCSVFTASPTQLPTSTSPTTAKPTTMAPTQLPTAQPTALPTLPPTLHPTYDLSAPSTCPNACSQHGQCVNNKCHCALGWLKEDCSTPADMGECYAKGKFCMFWSHDSENIYMQLDAETQGWVSLLFGYAEIGLSMYGSDCWVGWVENSNGDVKIQDRWSDKYVTPYLDEEQGGQQDLQGASGYQTQSRTVVAFHRKLKADSAKDFSVRPGLTNVAWSWGPGDSEFLIHTDEGRGDTGGLYLLSTNTPQSPPAPALKQDTVTTDSLTVEWAAPTKVQSERAHEYELQMASPTSDFTTVFSGPTPLLLFRLTDLTPSTTYRFRVRASNSYGAGEFSPVSSFQTFGFSAPAAPGSIVYTIKTRTTTSVKVEWVRSISKVDSYQVEARETPENVDPSAPQWHPVYSGSSARTSATITGLTPGTIYAFRVRGSNQYGAGNFSSSSLPVSTLGGPAHQVPDKATAVTVTPDHSFLALSWSDPVLHGLELLDFEVQLRTAATSGWTTVYKGLDTKFNISELQHGADYQVRLAATNELGSSEWSSHFEYKTLSYQHSYCPDKRFCIHYSVDGDYLKMTMTAKTLGWTSLILGAPDGMTNGDCWVAFPPANIPTRKPMEDGWSTGLITPQLGGENNDLEVFWVRAAQGEVSVAFQRKLDTKDLKDVKIVNRMLDVAWSFGPKELGFDEHLGGDYGRWKMNFFTGEVETLACWGYCSMYAWGGGILAIIIAGLISRAPCFYLSRCGQFVMYHKVGKLQYPASKICLSAKPTCMDLSGDQIVCIAIYCTAVAGVCVLSWHKVMLMGKHWTYLFSRLCELHLTIVFFPVTRNSVWLPILGIPFERAIKFHRWLGRLALLYTFIHGLTMVLIKNPEILWANTLTIEGSGVVYGTISFVLFVVITLFSTECIRRKHFEVFMTAHFLFIPAIVLACLHDHFFIYPLSVPIVLYVGDRVLRKYKSSSKVEVKECMVIKSGPPNAPRSKVLKLELRVRNFRFEAGQYAFINIPQISKLQWHPFSISSAPSLAEPPTSSSSSSSSFDVEDLGHSNSSTRVAGESSSSPCTNTGGDITFHCLESEESTFTGALRKLIKANQLTQVKVDGPYGGLSIPIEAYSHLVLVGGGVGVTPMMSLLIDLMDRVDAGDIGLKHLEKVHFVWASRYTEPFTHWFPHQLKRAQSHPSRKFKIYLHATNPPTYCVDHVQLGRKLKKAKSKKNFKQDCLKDTKIGIQNNNAIDVGSEMLKISGLNDPNLVDCDEIALDIAMDIVDAVEVIEGIDVEADKGERDGEELNSEKNIIVSKGGKKDRFASKYLYKGLHIRPGQCDLPQLMATIRSRLTTSNSDGSVTQDTADYKVGVAVCGPDPLVISCQNGARDQGFHVHKETFAL